MCNVRHTLSSIFKILPVWLVLASGSVSQGSGSIAHPEDIGLRALKAQLKMVQTEFYEDGTGVIPVDSFTKPVDGFILSRLNAGIGTKTLENEIEEAFRSSFTNSWAEHPVAVLPSFPPDGSARLVSLTVSYGADSRTVLEVYARVAGKYRLMASVHSYLGGLETHVVPSPRSRARDHFLVYGRIFGASQAGSKAFLFHVSTGGISALWKMRGTLGLSVAVQGPSIAMRYGDVNGFYNRVPLDIFQDTYVDSGTKLRLTKRVMLPDGRQ